MLVSLRHVINSLLCILWAVVASAAAQTFVGTAQLGRNVTVWFKVPVREVNALGVWFEVKGDANVTKYLLQSYLDGETTPFNTVDLPSHLDWHRVEYLASDTKYRLKLTTYFSSGDTIVEFQDTATIPIMRTDSIVALCVTLGYILLTVLAGALHWKRRQWEHEKHRSKEGRLKSQTPSPDREIPETNTKPSCSIEETNSHRA